jgi:hypothetical protein
MNANEIYEIEEFVNDESEFMTNKLTSKLKRRKWREIENYKEQQRLRRELQEYSQYGL